MLAWNTTYKHLPVTRSAKSIKFYQIVYTSYVQYVLAFIIKPYMSNEAICMQNKAK